MTKWALLIPVLLFLHLAHADSIPAAPYYYVLDEPHILSPKALRSIETLLIEHDRIAGEQVMIAIFKSAGPEDLEEYAKSVFSAWKVGKHGKGDGALLVLYWDKRTAKIIVSYGLEAALTEAKSSQIVSETLLPELKNSNPDRALSLTSLEILRVLDSPLIQSGKAEELLQPGAIQQDSNTDLEPTPRSGGVLLWLFLGFAILCGVGRALTSSEAHFTRDGWVRYNPWLFPRRRKNASRAIQAAGASGRWQ